MGGICVTLGYVGGMETLVGFYDDYGCVLFWNSKKIRHNFLDLSHS